MAFMEDLDQFFEDDDFAEEVMVTFASGATRSFMAIVETPTQGVGVYEAEVESDAPYLRCKTGDTTGIRRENTVSVRDETWIVERVRHEGTGVSLIYFRTV